MEREYDEDAAIMMRMLNDVMEAEEIEQQPQKRHNVRSDPFTINAANFLQMFRMNKDTAREVIEELSPYLEGPSRVGALTKEHKVLITLNHFSHGSYQGITGRNLYADCSQSTVSQTIEEVTNALNQPRILKKYIHFPETLEQLQIARARFTQKYPDIPGIIGVIDCTHVAIVRPVEDEHVYVNRKRYHSLNVQLICDENLQIINVDARFPGSCHDSHIWRQSVISTTVETIHRHNNEDPYFLIGDSGYPLRPWLITPIDQPATAAEETFNEKFRSIRCIIERCNGVLKNRFRCLLEDRVLHYKPFKASKIVNACVVLHNICIGSNVPIPEVEEDFVVNNNIGYGFQNIQQNEFMARLNPDLLEGKRRRQQIVDTFG